MANLTEWAVAEIEKYAANHEDTHPHIVSCKEVLKADTMAKGIQITIFPSTEKDHVVFRKKD